MVRQGVECCARIRAQYRGTKKVHTETQLLMKKNLGGGEMACRVCAADNLRKFDADLTVNSTNIQGITAPPVYFCQQLLVCLDCGFAELRVPPTELMLLKKSK